MTILNATQARSDFYNLIDQVSLTHEPTLIRGKRHNAVLVSEEDWNAVQETLYLLSIKGMRESIHKGLETPLLETKESLDW